MVYVLEWRDTRSERRSRDGRAVVSHVRVFRSAAAIKGFLRSQRRAQPPGGEFRLSVRGRSSDPASVFTTGPAIIEWDARATALPTPANRSAWSDELEAMALSVRLTMRVGRELARAEQAGLLSRRDADRLLAVLERLLTNAAPTPP